ncbi:MAG TPA: hypothetical protein VGG34_01440 [Opitutaceae bacterium]|jgi:hypothetical protein
METTQSNTVIGSRQVIAAEGLYGNEGKLIVLYSNAGVPTVRMPNATTDIPTYLLIDDGLPQNAVDNGGQYVDGLPLSPDRNERITCYGAGAAGTILVMADPTANGGAQAGMVTALPAGAGKYVQIGVAEEDFVDGQLVLLRPELKSIIVSTAVAAPAALTSAQIGAAPTEANFNALQADVAALLATVAALRAALATNGQVH